MRTATQRYGSPLTSMSRFGTAQASVALQAIVVRLCDGEVWATLPASSAATMRCLSGTVWVTQDGVAGDRIVRAGGSFVAGGRGKIVVQSLGDASLRYVDDDVDSNGIGFDA